MGVSGTNGIFRSVLWFYDAWRRVVQDEALIYGRNREKQEVAFYRIQKD
jgi:hypothetical protein